MVDTLPKCAKPGYSLSRTERKREEKQDVPGSFVHHSQKLQTTQRLHLLPTNDGHFSGTKRDKLLTHQNG